MGVVEEVLAYQRVHALDEPRAVQVPQPQREEDEPEEIVTSGIPGVIRFGFPGRWDDPCEGCRPRPFGIVGVEPFDPGYAGDPVRTSWRKLADEPGSR